MLRDERTARMVCSQEEAAQRRRNREWMHWMWTMTACSAVPFDSRGASSARVPPYVVFAAPNVCQQSTALMHMRSGGAAVVSSCMYHPTPASARLYYYILLTRRLVRPRDRSCQVWRLTTLSVLLDAPWLRDCMPIPASRIRPVLPQTSARGAAQIITRITEGPVRPLRTVTACPSFRASYSAPTLAHNKSLTVG